MTVFRRIRAGAACLLWTAFVVGCDTPHTTVVLENQYPPSATNSMVVYRAFWQAVSFSTPISPGASSDEMNTVAASSNTAYVLLAPGWDPASMTRPTSLVVLQSDVGFAVHWNHSLHIPVDDTTFAGNCVAGSVLTSTQTDFITQRVFANDFVGLTYDAATCTTTGP